MATVCLGYRRIAYDWLCASWKTSIDQYYAKPTFKFLMSLGRKMDRSCHSEVWLFHASTPAHKSFYWLLSKLSATVNLHSSTTPPAAQPWLPAIRNLKYRLRGTWFIDDESLKIAVEAWFESQDGEFYFQGINSWEKSWKKCIDVAGEYYVARWQCVCVWYRMLIFIAKLQNFLIAPRASICRQTIFYLFCLTTQVDWLWSEVGGHPALSLHSSNEPGELSQWLWHDDSTINIVAVAIIAITYINLYSPSL